MTTVKTPERRLWWIHTAGAVLLLWVIGAYVPAISNVWVTLNLVVPAGEPSMFTFPLAYPAVGADMNTLTSLAGLLLLICPTIAWFTYIERAAQPEAAQTRQ
ncbi:Uncharacterised protein [Mycobacteroides abscessus subsp. abscessus]|nr:Uncharacterised protein [Mycobacteroides abscessus subsp. abscessus]